MLWRVVTKGEAAIVRGVLQRLAVHFHVITGCFISRTSTRVEPATVCEVLQRDGFGVPCGCCGEFCVLRLASCVRVCGLDFLLGVLQGP